LLVDALIDLGEMHRLASATTEALTYFTDARAVAHRLGDQLDLATLALNIGYIHRDSGLWKEAAEELTTSRGIFAHMHDDYHEAEALIALAELHRRQGNLPSADECLDAGEALAERCGRHNMRLRAAIARAHLLIDQGRAADAVRTVRAVLAHPAADTSTVGEAEQILNRALTALHGAGRYEPSDGVHAA
jgi:tetratricopeptide (TPR) repeat protein